MGWQRWRAAPGPRPSRLHTCWPTSSGGELTTILYALMQRCGRGSCSRENEGADCWRNAIGNGRQPWQREERTVDGQPGRCSRAPCQRFPLESDDSQVQLPCHGVEEVV